jgi:hypothetical protein
VKHEVVWVEGLIVHMLVGLWRIAHEARIIAGCSLEVWLVVPAVRGVVELVRAGLERLLVLSVGRHRDDQGSFNE